MYIYLFLKIMEIVKKAFDTRTGQKFQYLLKLVNA